MNVFIFIVSFFDFRYYHFMGLGDYIMYSNTERNFEVGNIIVKMVKLLAWPTLTAQLN